MATTALLPNAIYAEDDFISDVQFAIHNLLQNKGMSRADLARALSVSEPRVSQIFSDSARNLTLRTIARIFFVLNERPRLTSPTLEKLLRQLAAEHETRPARHSRRSDDAVLAYLRDALSAHNAFGEMTTNDNVDEPDVARAA